MTPRRPVPPHDPDDPSHTTDRLRKDIDRGVAGDKVPFPDPAAAPLGTDDEAAGAPPSRASIATARAHETRGVPPLGPGATDEQARGEGRAARAGDFFWLWPMAAVVLAVLAVVAWMLS